MNNIKKYLFTVIDKPFFKQVRQITPRFNKTIRNKYFLFTAVLIISILVLGTFEFKKLTGTSVSERFKEVTPSLSTSPTPILYHQEELYSKRVLEAKNLLQAKQEVVRDVRWLAQSEKMNGVEVAKVYDAEFPQAEFYRVAEFPDNSILINGFIPEYNGDLYLGDIFIRLIRTQDKKYSWLVNYPKSMRERYYRVEDYLSGIDGLLLPEVLVAVENIEGLEMPDQIKFGQGILLESRSRYDKNRFFSSLENPRKLIETPYGPVYEIISKTTESGEVFTRHLYLVLKDNYLVEYKLTNSNFLSSDFYHGEGSVPEIFLDVDGGKRNERKYSLGRYSECFSDPVLVIQNNSPLVADKVQIGKTISGDSLYQILNPKSEIVNVLFKISRNLFGGKIDETTIEEVAKDGNYFLWQDPFGDWLIFINSKYAWGAPGCS